MPSAHALLSASGAAKWLNCPPSARLEEKFPNTSSDYAKEGTVAHTLAEISTRYNLNELSKQEFESEKDDLLATEDGEKFYNEEMQEHARALGANAVIGVDLDYETVGGSGSMLMVTACGTAVTVE